ncbi:MAG: hypothetical protein Q9174_005860, partial [Haloplaca sp. 1 TL-2023]
RKARQEERRAIIEWLSPLQYRRRQSEIYNDAVFLGQSFLESNEYKAWREGRPWTLYGYGLPGAGKTVLSSIIVNQLQTQLPPAKTPVLCIFLNHKEHRQTITNVIGSLLKQLVQLQGDDFRSTEVRRLFREATGEAAPMLDSLYAALKAEIETFERVILVIDALDEASISLETQLLDKLRPLSASKLSVLITSRPRDDIATIPLRCDICSKVQPKILYNCPICNNGQFDLCQECVDNGIHCYVQDHELIGPLEVTIDIEPTDDEIRAYVNYEIQRELAFGKVTTRDRRFKTSQRGTTRLARICDSDPELKTIIPDRILASCNGMFMLARLFMSSVKTKTSPEEVRTALENLPQGYDDSYKATMERIEAPSVIDPNDSSSRLAKRILLWVACSYRPLSLVELQEVLAIDLDRPDIRSSYRRDKETMLEVTAGLLFVSADEQTIHLCHGTAYEYFDKSREFWFPDSASHMARCCLQYLSRPELAEPCEGIREDSEFDQRRKLLPFLSYAYVYWGDHVRHANDDLAAVGAALRYLEDPKRVASFVQAAWYLSSSGPENWDVRKGANSLHVAAWFGLPMTVRQVIQSGVDVNSEDRHGQTPLMIACRKGHVLTVSILLGQGAFINTRSHAENTALLEAVSGAHSDVVVRLLEDDRLDVNYGHFGDAEHTAMMFAAKDDNTTILCQLCDDARTDVNRQDLYGVTALSIAAKAGHVESVRCLLRHDNIDVDLAEQDRRTALIHAASLGHSIIVDELLASGASPATKDQEGGTALLRAIDHGQTLVAEILMGVDGADTTITDGHRRTFLHGAAVNGHVDIVRLLIDKGLDKDAQDRHGRTPLHDGCRNGTVEVVKELLKAGANQHIKDEWNRSAWDVAWLHGQAAVLSELDGKPSDPISAKKLMESYPDLSALPAWSMAKLGRIDVLERVIRERPQSLGHLDPDTENTALHTAVLADHPSIVELLLRANLSPDGLNAESRTALHVAARKGRLDCVKALLKYKPELNIQDEFRHTPLLIAEIVGQPEIALMLIEAGAEIDTHRLQIQPLFFAAVEFARPKALQILIDKGANVTEKNIAGKTALRVAKDLAQDAEGGSADDMAEIIQVLQENKSRYVKVGESQDIDEVEEDDQHRFQMSAFRRPDVWEDDEE